MSRNKDTFANDLLNLFFEEEQLLAQELNDTNALYDELYTHFNNVKDSRTGGSLRFISDQAKNLISLKDHRLATIERKIGVKSKITDIYFKDKAANTGTSDTAAIMEALRNLTNLPENTPTRIENEDDTDIDAIFEQKGLQFMKTGEIDKDFIHGQETKVESKNDDEIEFIFDMERNIYAMDNEGDILENYICPDIEVELYMDENDEPYAEDASGNIYQIVEFEEN